MSSPCDPRHAPAGDVSTGLMMIDSRLKAIYDGRTGADPEQQALVQQFTASLTSKDFRELLDGTCTIIFMFMTWLRQAYEAHDKDVVEYVVPDIVTTLRAMPRSVRPEAVPTMAGLVVAAATGLSPNLWRRQYGEWTEEEMNALEATAFLLAEHINRLADDRDFATRLIAEALAGAEAD
ncbi:hypothetical protein [Streptomyces antimicrobicus]|uniref:Uncharacterized protein n=1 Tax=Streptomyces antimicrobicus TaxID=2883108 RepID=A0ABS8B3P8_9ACTN|nr:hypothetical protein [Streptomyces antimicrobicus]MCB5179231.1 hypothetical protein [Streptomyces antimicrobicus]